MTRENAANWKLTADRLPALDGVMDVLDAQERFCDLRLHLLERPDLQAALEDLCADHRAFFELAGVEQPEPRPTALQTAITSQIRLCKIGLQRLTAPDLQGALEDLVAAHEVFLARVDGLACARCGRYFAVGSASRPVGHGLFVCAVDCA